MGDIEPGSPGEHILQDECGTADRAGKFYGTQVTAALTPKMMEFISRMEMAFIATADATGECDSSFRAGPPGFIRVLGERALAYPEYRGNGVMASLGNILANPHIGILLVDFTRDLIGLHVNGYAQVLSPEAMAALDPHLPPPAGNGRRPEHWVAITVEEAYIHCSKHIPLMEPRSRVRHWGTDNPRFKGGDYFGAAASRPGPGTTAASQ